MDDQLGVSWVSSLLNAFTSLTVWWFRPSICSVHSDFFDISSTRSHGCKLFDHEVFGQSFLKHFLVAASCSTSQSRHGTTDSSEWHRQGETASVKNCHNERCAPSCVPYMTLSRTACPILILIVFAWHLDHDDATCARLISQNPKTVTSASTRRSSVMHQLIMSLRLTGDGVAANALLASSGVNSQLGNQCAASRLALLFAASVQRPPRQLLQSVTSSQARPNPRTTNAAKLFSGASRSSMRPVSSSKLGLRSVMNAPTCFVAVL